LSGALRQRDRLVPSAVGLLGDVVVDVITIGNCWRKGGVCYPVSQLLPLQKAQRVAKQRIFVFLVYADPLQISMSKHMDSLTAPLAGTELATGEGQ